MPAEIDAVARGDIVYYAALGYSQVEIADELDLSRNTVRKYLEKARVHVEGAEDPRETLSAIVTAEYDWDGDGVRSSRWTELMSM